jgi:hypothetical protein
MTRVLQTGFAAAAFALMMGTAAAHHSFSAEFDADRPLKLTGKVVEMRWSNPHAWIYIEVTGKDGKLEKWAWERAAPISCTDAAGVKRTWWRVPCS